MKCYRTPGGNIRILLEHLLDFSRECDLPLDLGNSPFTPSVMVYVHDRELRERLLGTTLLANRNLLLVPIFSRSNLWRMLHTMHPRYVVLEHEPGSRGTDCCGEIRRVLAPLGVKVGIVHHPNQSVEAGAGADALVCDDADAVGITSFWQQLLEHESEALPPGSKNLKIVTGPPFSGACSHAS